MKMRSSILRRPVCIRLRPYGEPGWCCLSCRTRFNRSRSREGLPLRCIGLAIGTLEHLDDTIAMAGLLGGTSARVQAAQASPTKTSITSSAGVLAADQSPGKHDCKGKNACKGQGGCKSSDNGCKRKNSCKGKGDCSGKKG